MWIVRLALNRPYTFIVFALVIILISPLVITRTPTDIFPEINIPVVSIVWNYSGLSATDIEARIVSGYERSLTTTVDNIQHVESQTEEGRSIIKVYFQPAAKIATATAQITAISATAIRSMPPGTSPPLVITYSASTVPIMQLGLRGDGLSEQELNDLAVNFVRNRLAAIPGAATPYPYGGKQRLVAVNVDIAALQAKGLSPVDVINAVSVQNLILPSGSVKLGSIEYPVDMNGSTSTIAELNNLPIKTVNGATVYIRDVAYVSDGFSPQTNIVRMDGQRGVLLSVFKTGGSSTLDIVSQLRSLIPHIMPTLPPALRITQMFDQSVFVRAAVQGVIREALIAACLTALMILLFLGNWRSTLIIAISIPLSILVSICVLSALGETINIMTLGGLALAVGILVDDATVEIENINRLLRAGQGNCTRDSRRCTTNCRASLRFHNLHLYCVRADVFPYGRRKIPFRAAGRGRRLRHVGLVSPFSNTCSHHGDVPGCGHHGEQSSATGGDPFSAIQRGFVDGFERMREGYRSALSFCLDHAVTFIVLFPVTLFCVRSYRVGLGAGLFPGVDAGLIRLHMRGGEWVSASKKPLP